MKQKILGTVQLGMPYGINNGLMPERDYSLKLLECAYDLGIRYLDTARAYGNSLEVIGDYHRKYPAKKFRVYSKFMLEDLATDFSALINQQKMILGLEELEGFYFHRFSDYELSSRIISNLPQEDAAMIGVSIYSAQELQKISNDPKVKIIQVPMSIFHHHSELKTELDNTNDKKIYGRSIFLQGLLFISEEKLTGKLAPFLGLKIFLKQTSNELGLSLLELAAGYVMDMSKLDGVLFGAEKLEQVKETERILRARALDWDYILKKMPKVSDEVLNPGNWQ